MSDTKKFERHFEGSDNAGIRSLIRMRVSHIAACCEREKRERILSLHHTVALTASGLANLTKAADDYASMCGFYVPDCPCTRCNPPALVQASQ